MVYARESASVSNFALRITNKLNPRADTQDDSGLLFSEGETNVNGWRLTVEESLGRLKWKYCGSDDKCVPRAEVTASKYYLGQSMGCSFSGL